MSLPLNNRPKNNKSQKTIRRWHRWVGYSSLILVFILSLTGLILNRTEILDLNQVTIRNELVSSLYGLSPKAPPVHFTTGEHWLSWLEGRLYLDSRLIDQNTDRPVGVAQVDQFIIVGAKNRLSLYLKEGSLVETLNMSSLPGPISALGRTDAGRLLVESENGKFTPDDDFISWTAVTEPVYYSPSHPQPAPQQITEKILEDYQGQGITLYRLILDLHSGHILGSFGPYLMDLAAISLIFLGVTGLMKRKRSDRNRRNRK